MGQRKTDYLHVVVLCYMIWQKYVFLSRNVECVCTKLSYIHCLLMCHVKFHL
jgi:hypothetical protein